MAPIGPGPDDQQLGLYDVEQLIATHYPTQAALARLLVHAGVPPAQVDLSGAPMVASHIAVRAALAMGRLNVLLEVVWRDFPDVPRPGAPAGPTGGESQPVAVRFASRVPQERARYLIHALRGQGLDVTESLPLDDRGPGVDMARLALIAFVRGLAWRLGTATGDQLTTMAGVHLRSWLREQPNEKAEGLLQDSKTGVAAVVTPSTPDAALACLTQVLSDRGVHRAPVVWDGERWADEHEPRTGPQIADLVSSEAAPRHTVVCLATEWGSGFGGLSTYNRRLCEGLAEVAVAVCVVPATRADGVQVDAAAEKDVILVRAPVRLDDDPDLALWSQPPLPVGVTPTVLVGHGRFTGSAAEQLAAEVFPLAARVHLVHAAPDEVDWWKVPEPGRAVHIEEKDRKELKLGRGADVMGIVGRRTFDRLKPKMPNHPNVIMLNPGFQHLPQAPRPPERMPKVLLFGRVEDDRVKGVDIAVSALASANEYLDEWHRPELVIRGGTAEESEALRTEICEVILAAARTGPPLDVVTRVFTIDEAVVADDLDAATLVLMPSRAEAFGLAGVEAIEHGRPLLVSARSGLAAYLRDDSGLDGELVSRIVVQDVAPDQMLNHWERRIRDVLVNPGPAFDRMAQVREHLIVRRPWKVVAGELLDAVRAARADA